MACYILFIYSFIHFGLCTHDKIGQDRKFDMKHQLLFTIQCGDQSYKKKIPNM